MQSNREKLIEKLRAYAFDENGEVEFSREDAVAALSSMEAGAVKGSPFEFDRYVNGQLMAEGVTIERETTLAGAMQKAAAIASRGPRGEVPVLVLRAPAGTEAGARVTDEMVEAAISAYNRSTGYAFPQASHKEQKAGMRAALEAALAQPASGEGCREPVQFPTMLRKMWSGTEVQKWIDENVNRRPS